MDGVGVVSRVEGMSGMSGRGGSMYSSLVMMQVKVQYSSQDSNRHSDVRWTAT